MTVLISTTRNQNILHLRHYPLYLQYNNPMYLIHNISQLITLTPEPQRGHSLGTLGILNEAAILIDGETIAAIGETAQLLEEFPQADRLDAGGRAVVPGFVDPHTHLVWAGDRVNEFEMRLQGKSYMEIMEAGGGIAATVNATRAASLDELISTARQRTQNAFRMGTTTMEAKSGYGLDMETEYRQLEAILALDAEGPLELIPTWMGAHAIAPEYKGNPEAYLQFLCDRAIPDLREWWQKHAPDKPLPFVDVFCEHGVFELDATRQIMLTASAHGFPLKLHVDEFANLGGASLAAELQAVSADHLVRTGRGDIRALAESDTVAVALPGTPFGLGQKEYTPALEIIEADGYLAIASDLNPGTTWNESMQFIQALACRYLKLTPAQALVAATLNAAAAVSASDRLGSLQLGKQADLLILDSPDYRNLSYRYGGNQVAVVVKRGKVYFQD
jgi:imidazolonepropionase